MAKPKVVIKVQTRVSAGYSVGVPHPMPPAATYALATVGP